MRQVLAVLEEATTAPAVLAAASLASARLEQAAIAVLHVRRDSDPTFIPGEEVMTPARRRHFQDAEAARSATVRAAFDAWPGHAGATFRELAGDEPTLVALEGARADLIVIGRAPHYRPREGRTTVEAALFAAPPPVLLVPAAVPDALGAHIAVAWKPGEVAERAIVAATPLLRRAARITLLIGAEAGRAADVPSLSAITGAALVGAEVRHFVPDGAGVAAALLREARESGADLMVMGAYSHRRAVEALLGGATRGILESADLPVLLHH